MATYRTRSPVSPSTSDIISHVASFEQATGAHLKVVEYYNPFPGSFQLSEATEAINQGATPMIQLNPRKVTMQQIVDGQFDAEIRSYAQAVKAFACHVILSFGHEMNGWWYPWGMPDTPPSVFKAAWRHFHDVFAAAGVRNVIWSWDPTHQYQQYRAGKVATDASAWYPGNKYVDLIGVDGYLNPGQDFTVVFAHVLGEHPERRAEADLHSRDRGGTRLECHRAGRRTFRGTPSLQAGRTDLV